MRPFATSTRPSRVSRRLSSLVPWASPKSPSTRTTTRQSKALPRFPSPARPPEMRGLWGVAAALLLCATPAHADERILRYFSDIQVQKDSSVEVAETIDVRVEHDQIN